MGDWAMEILSPNVAHGDMVVGSGKGNLAILSSDSMAVDKGGCIGLGGNRTGTSSRGAFASICGRKENSTSANWAGYLDLAVTQSVGSVLKALSINSSGGVTIPGSSFSVGTSTLVVTAGKVGVGASPTLGGSGTLEVTGSIYSGTAGLYAQLGYNTVRTYGADFYYDNASVGFDSFFRTSKAGALDTTAMSILAEGNVNVPTGLFSVGTDTFTVKAGKVGIGTANPGSPLQISGGRVQLGGGQSDTVADSDIAGDSGYWHMRTPTNNGFALDMYNGSSYVQALTMLPSGNVGIGTAAPSSKLHIAGASQALLADPSANFGNAYIGSTSDIGAGVGASLGLGGVVVNATGQQIAFGRISGRKEAATSGVWDGFLAFETSNNTGSPYVKEQMRITSTGKVGIGISTGTATLHIMTPAGTDKDAYALKISSGGSGASVWGVHNDGHHSFYGADAAIATCLNATLVGHDSAGSITMTGANSSCEISFGSAWDAQPICVTGQKIADKLENVNIAALTTTSITFVPAQGAWESDDVINYICVGSH
jgi:hypothetical protein